MNVTECGVTHEWNWEFVASDMDVVGRLCRCDDIRMAVCYLTWYVIALIWLAIFLTEFLEISSLQQSNRTCFCHVIENYANNSEDQPKVQATGE